MGFKDKTRTNIHRFPWGSPYLASRPQGRGWKESGSVGVCCYVYTAGSTMLMQNTQGVCGGGWGGKGALCIRKKTQIGHRPRVGKQAARTQLRLWVKETNSAYVLTRVCPGACRANRGIHLALIYMGGEVYGLNPGVFSIINQELIFFFHFFLHGCLK